MSSRPELVVDWCSYEAAKYAVEHWHYSGSLPYAGKMVKIGVWESDLYVGAVLFSWGANKNIGSPYGLELGQVVELVRVALRQHGSQVSEIVSRSIKMVKQQSPGLRLIVSYADSAEGHLGIIYQAMNWIYTGSTKGTKLYKLNGRLVHQRLASRELGTIAGLNGQYSSDKHKYLYPLDRAMRKQILPLAQPYPKRATEAKSVHAPADQAGKSRGRAEPVALSTNFNE